MTIFRFIDFIAYKNAIQLRKDIKFLILRLTNLKEFDLKNQINRASISIILNIAEGSSRSSDKDFRRFLEISLGSVYEVVAGLDVCLSEQLINIEEYNILLSKCEFQAIKLGTFMKKLKESI